MNNTTLCSCYSQSTLKCTPTPEVFLLSASFSQLWDPHIFKFHTCTDGMYSTRRIQCATHFPLSVCERQTSPLRSRLSSSPSLPLRPERQKLSQLDAQEDPSDRSSSSEQATATPAHTHTRAAAERDRRRQGRPHPLAVPCLSPLSSRSPHSSATAPFSLTTQGARRSPLSRSISFCPTRVCMSMSMHNVF